MERLRETSKEKHGGKFVHWFGGADSWAGCEHGDPLSKFAEEEGF